MAKANKIRENRNGSPATIRKPTVRLAVPAARCPVSSEARDVASSEWASSDSEVVRLRYRPSLALLCARGEQPGLPPYFSSDDKPLACHRARLRLDQALLFGSLHRRRLEATSICPNCGFADESPAHVLLDCPIFAAERTRLAAQLARFSSLRVYLLVL